LDGVAGHERRRGSLTVGGDRIATRTIVWAPASGLSARDSLGWRLDRIGRVPVDLDLSVLGQPRVFVMRDLAALEQAGRPVPGVAPAGDPDGRPRRGQHPPRARRPALPPLPLP